jgi:GTP-binding protein
MVEIQTKFVTSSSKVTECPPPDRPEFAFIGRSNVGKSSLINMLAGKKQLAKISSKPGKTQLINHFDVDDRAYFVDLPGYGWAKVSKAMKIQWDQMTREYLMERENLICVFVLIDSSIQPQEIDMEFMEWLGVNQIPFSVVFTKGDKKSVKVTRNNRTQFKKRMLEQWETLPAFFLTSSVRKHGKKELLDYVMELAENVENK